MHTNAGSAAGVEQEPVEQSELLRLLVSTRAQLSKALEEANELQANEYGSEDEEEEDDEPRLGGRRAEQISEESLARMPAREREAAIKRAKNREAARRSRQRKTERIKALYKDISALQQENLLLLKCIEEFMQKTLAGKAAQAEMQAQLEQLAVGGAAGCGEAQAPLDASGSEARAVPMPGEGLLQHEAMREQAEGVQASGHHRRGVSLLSFDEHDKGPKAEDLGQLSSRATLSAYMWPSCDNTPRDDLPGGDAARPGKPAAVGGPPAHHQQHQQHHHHHHHEQQQEMHVVPGPSSGGTLAQPVRPGGGGEGQ